MSFLPDFYRKKCHFYSKIYWKNVIISNSLDLPIFLLATHMEVIA